MNSLGFWTFDFFFAGKTHEKDQFSWLNWSFALVFKHFHFKMFKNTGEFNTFLKKVLNSPVFFNILKWKCLKTHAKNQFIEINWSFSCVLPAKKKSNVQKPSEFISLLRQVIEFTCVFEHFNIQNFKNQWFFDVGFQKQWFLPVHFSWNC